MIFRSIILFAIAWLAQGCIGGFGFVYKEHLFGNYYLIETDEVQMSLSYHAPEDGSNYGGVIPETVFAVGFNEKYIIVKQHPRSFPKHPDKKITNYYIVPVTDGFNYRTMNGMCGPLTLNQFSEKRIELGIPDSLNFTKEFEDLK